MHFRIDCAPPTATAQQKGVFVRGGRAHFYVKPKVRQGENFLAALLAPHAPPAPFSRPALRVLWTFPYRKGERKSVVRSGAVIPHTTRFDLDNLEKSLLDVMTRLRFWEDDSRITAKHTVKRMGPRPGIEIWVREATLEDLA